MSSSRLRNYFLALLIFAAAFGARLLLDYIVPDRLPFITYFPAVFLAAYFCGLGPGLVVLGLSAIAGASWVDVTGQGPVVYAFSLALFLALASIILVLIHQLRTAHQALQHHDEQLALINRELKHRIKNLFSITNSICKRTIMAGGSVDEMTQAVSGRILAIASAQDLLSVTASEGAELGELVNSLVSTLSPRPAALQIEGEKFRLAAEVTTPMAVVLHELATNALKYGAWSVEGGQIEVSWKIESETLLFRWREHDGPVLAPPIREGLGRTLIQSSLPGARVNHSFRPDGLECEIDLPLSGATGY
jgi:two-component sensor histidine kinase